MSKVVIQMKFCVYIFNSESKHNKTLKPMYKMPHIYEKMYKFFYQNRVIHLNQQNVVTSLTIQPIRPLDNCNFLTSIIYSEFMLRNCT